MGISCFFHKMVIDYGYWLDLLTVSLEIWEWAEIILFQKFRFLLLHNIVDIIDFLLLGATYTLTKVFATSNAYILLFSFQMQQYKQF